MPQRKNETEEQWMERVRAARFYCNNSNDAGIELAGFMSLFHPDHPEDSVREMVRDARDQQRRRNHL